MKLLVSRYERTQQTEEDVPEHLLKDVAELFAAKLVRIFFRLCLATETKGAPWEAETSSLLATRLWSRDLLLWISVAAWRSCVGA